MDRRRPCRTATVLGWSVRAAALASLIVLSFFVGAHLSELDGPTPTSSEWGGLSLFPVGVMLGTALSLWRASAGGILVVVSLTGFYVWHYVHAGRFPSGPYFVLFSLPGIFFFLQALLNLTGSLRRPPQDLESPR